MDSQVQLRYQTDVNELDKFVRKFYRNEGPSPALVTGSILKAFGNGLSKWCPTFSAKLAVKVIWCSGGGISDWWLPDNLDGGLNGFAKIFADSKGTVAKAKLIFHCLQHIND